MSPQRSIALADGDGGGIEAVAALAASRGWPLSDDTPRGHHEPRTLVWAVDQSTSVGYVEAHQFGTRHLELSGPDPAVLADLDAWLRARVSHHDEARLLAGAMDAAPLGLLRALPVIASFHPAVESEPYLAVYRRALAHELLAVRRVAAISAAARSALGSWPALLALVAERRRLEPDQALARLLAGIA